MACNSLAMCPFSRVVFYAVSNAPHCGVSKITTKSSILNKSTSGVALAIAHNESPTSPAMCTTKETAMNGFIAYAEFAGAIIASIGLALGLEWIGMNGLFRLMPGRLHQQVPVRHNENIADKK